MTDVVVLRALGLGDALTGVPALRALRRAVPGARLHLVGPEHLGRFLAARGVVDEVVPFDGVHGLDGPVPHVGADLGVNLHGRGPQSHEVVRALGAERLVAFADPLGGHPGPPWRDDDHEVTRWVRLVTTVLGGSPRSDDLLLPAPGARGGHVVVHPGAASGARRWPVERWAEVARRLVAAGREVHVTGSAAEAPLGRELARASSSVVDRCGRDDLDSLAEVVGTAALVCCGDTGVAHLATAFATPSVVLFGPLSPFLWGPPPDGGRHRALWAGDDGDLRPGNPHADEADERLLALDVDEVWAAAEEVAQAIRSRSAGPAALSS